MYGDSIAHEIKSTINIIPRTDVEIISFIQGKLKILPEFINEDIIKGYTRLISNGNIDYFIPVKVEIKKQDISKDLLTGITRLDSTRYNEKILNGNLSFDNHSFGEDILTGTVRPICMKQEDIIFGSLTCNKEDKNEDILTGNITIENEELTKNLLYGTAEIKTNKQYWTLLECDDIKIETDTYSEDILEGSINFEMGERVRDIYGRAFLEKDDVNEDIIEGTTTITRDKAEIDLLKGTLSIYSHYSAAEFPCTIKVNKKQFVHSIFCKLKVPNDRNYEIPCTIQVEGMNKIDPIIIQGTVSLLEKEAYSQDILNNNSVVYLPGATVDIECSAHIDPVYTRKELLYCRINAVNTTDFDIPCKVEVEPPADYWYHQEILYSRIIIGTPHNHYIPSTVKVEANDSGNIDFYQYQTYGPRPQTRIVIAVSPTWRYEPFVFKSSLITFLDRYYGKADFSIVFGGSARADFDIMNLCANYKIRKERLLRVPIIVDFKNPLVTQQSVDHFIHHMFSFKPEEPKIISRVFLFMNQPSWYYNDPLAKIAEACIHNQISCVAINGGGEYQELTLIDKLKDDMYNNIEYDRQQRMHPNYGFVNVNYVKDPNHITY